MFEVTDVVVAGVVSTVVSLIAYSSIKKDLNSTSTGLTDKKKRRQQSLAKRELWEHAAYTTALGLGMFMLFVVNASTNLSHFPFWPRLIVTFACYFAGLFILCLITHSLFGYFRNRSE